MVAVVGSASSSTRSTDPLHQTICLNICELFCGLGRAVGQVYVSEQYDFELNNPSSKVKVRGEKKLLKGRNKSFIW